MKTFQKGDIESMKRVIAQSNTITVSMAAFGDFYSYGGGIYEGKQCTPDCGWNKDERGRKFIVNHAVLLVGYGINEKGREFWVICLMIMETHYVIDFIIKLNN